MNKKYIGDSVYATIDEVGMVLTTENGFGPTNTIYLDFDTLHSLVEFALRHELISSKLLARSASC